MYILVPDSTPVLTSLSRPSRGSLYVEDLPLPTCNPMPRTTITNLTAPCCDVELAPRFLPRRGRKLGRNLELRGRAVTIHGAKMDRLSDCEVVLLLAKTPDALRDPKAQKYTLVFKSPEELDAFAKELGRHRLAVWPLLDHPPNT